MNLGRRPGSIFLTLHDGERCPPWPLLTGLGGGLGEGAGPCAPGPLPQIISSLSPLPAAAAAAAAARLPRSRRRRFPKRTPGGDEAEEMAPEKALPRSEANLELSKRSQELPEYQVGE